MKAHLTGNRFLLRIFFAMASCCIFLSSFAQKKTAFDSLEYAPGYPDYTIGQAEQLNTFPLPRYKTGTKLQRNFSWFDFLYLGYDYRKVIRKDGRCLYPQWNTKEHADAAVRIDAEMYKHWHYYFNIATPTYNYTMYKNPATIAGAQARYANEHPDVKVCTYIFWGSGNPSKAGFDSPKAYIRTSANIDPCGDTTFPNIAKDGLTEKYFLSQLISFLPKRDSLCKIDFVNENGETFGESWIPNAEGYRGKPFISCIQPDSDNARALRAAWQYKVFNTYKKQFIGNSSFPALKNASFSFYQVAGFLPDYYSEWSEMRKINTPFHHSYYATPDFYPGQADHSVFPRYSFYHGLDCIAEGRKYEISLGDAYFSPFICGGWFADSLNYRPGPWLAATKALAMMGAEFYYPAFFNTGNFSVKPPVDPRSYMYQVAVPAYAQAITSRYEKIFFHSSDFTYIKKGNSLVIYRKDASNPKGPVYAIHASVFSLGNYIPAPAEKTERVNIDGEELKLRCRSQGSTYIYDRSDSANPVFYQLDAWHEAVHPCYWSKNFDFEAELYDDSSSFQLRTERPAGAAPGDYTTFTTYVCFASEQATKKSLSYHFEPRKDTGTYYIWVRARSAAKNPGNVSALGITLDQQTSFTLKNIGKGEFKWYAVEIKGKPLPLRVSPDVEHTLRLQAQDQFVEIDRILLTTSPVFVNSIKGLNEN